MRRGTTWVLLLLAALVGCDRWDLKACGDACGKQGMRSWRAENIVSGSGCGPARTSPAECICNGAPAADGGR